MEGTSTPKAQARTPKSEIAVLLDKRYDSTLAPFTLKLRVKYTSSKDQLEYRIEYPTATGQPTTRRKIIDHPVGRPIDEIVNSLSLDVKNAGFDDSLNSLVCQELGVILRGPVVPVAEPLRHVPSLKELFVAELKAHRYILPTSLFAAWLTTRRYVWPLGWLLGAVASLASVKNVDMILQRAGLALRR